MYVCSFITYKYIYIYIYVDFREPNPRHPILPKNILGDYYKQVQLYKEEEEEEGKRGKSCGRERNKIPA